MSDTSGASTTPQQRFAAIAEAFRGMPDVTLPMEGPLSRRAFGSETLRVRNKIFAMLVRGRLVMKLPQARVDALVASGDGVRYDPGQGRKMKEWVSLEPTSDEDWLPLVREAMAFVAAQV